MTDKADRPPYAETDDDARVGPDRASTAGTPRWVKVFGLVLLLLVLLFVILRLTGVGGQHGPSRHGDSGDTTPAAGTVAETPGSGIGSHTGPPPGITHP